MNVFICQFCSSEKQNHNSWRNHERCCPSNPDRKYKNGMTGKRGSNQYIKSKELGLPIPAGPMKGKPNGSKGRKHTEETKNIISERMIKAHAEGRAWNIGKSRWNNEFSYPEKFFIEVVENEFQDKEYKNEFPIGIYSADFCWPHLMKVIEIDGDQHQRFEEYIERDKRKDEFLTSQGYQILRIVWKEMFHNPKEKIKECYEFIHST